MQPAPWTSGRPRGQAGVQPAPWTPGRPQNRQVCSQRPGPRGDSEDRQVCSQCPGPRGDPRTDRRAASAPDLWETPRTEAAGSWFRPMSVPPVLILPGSSTSFSLSITPPRGPSSLSALLEFLLSCLMHVYCTLPVRRTYTWGTWPLSSGL